jgi:hypothetical protein
MALRALGGIGQSLSIASGVDLATPAVAARRSRITTDIMLRGSFADAVDSIELLEPTAEFQERLGFELADTLY